MLGSIGTTEIVIIVLVLLLLFGNKELPKLIRTLLSGYRNVQRTTNDIKKDITSIIDDDLDG